MAIVPYTVLPLASGYIIFEVNTTLKIQISSLNVASKLLKNHKNYALPRGNTAL